MVMDFVKRAWDKAILLFILAATGFLTFFAVGKEGWANEYYAAAVKSMLMSWHNFFFVSFDPGGYVSIDKPPVAFWIQAASARLFGFHGWSLILPEALAAVCAVALVYHLVRRNFGKTTGLIAAGVLALTPVLAAVSRDNQPDPILIVVLLLAAWTLMLAAERTNPRWLLLSMALVGIGFNVKMLAAFMVLPSFYLVYWLFASAKAGRKAVHLAAATAVLLAVSLSWTTVVDMTPAAARPYVGSSRTNSVLELAIDYNGVQRLLGMGQPGGGPGPGAGFGRPARAGDGPGPGGPGVRAGQPSAAPARGQRPGGGPGGGFGFSGGSAGVFRFFDVQMAGQISWLLPLVFLGVLGSFLRAGRREERLAVVLWGMWLLPMLVFFSIAGFFHLYYLVLLAPAVAALAAIGTRELYRLYRDGRGLKAWLLPGALVADAAVEVFIISRYPGWSTWLTPVVGGLAALAALLLAALRVKAGGGRAARFAAGAGLVALLVAPAVWSTTPLLYGTNAVTPYAGPELAGGGFGAGRFSGRRVFQAAEAQAATRGHAVGAMRGTPAGSGGNSQLISFLLRHDKNEKFLVAVPSAMSAAPIILQTGKAVMAVGGFTGSDNILTVSRLARMVASGELRYFMLGGGHGGNRSAVAAWVRAHGVLVPQFAGSQLYDLRPEKTA